MGFELATVNNKLITIKMNKKQITKNLLQDKICRNCDNEYRGRCYVPWKDIDSAGNYIKDTKHKEKKIPIENTCFEWLPAGEWKQGRY